MIFVGTSGFQYPEWRGTFYPEKFSTARMLPYYAERFNTTEINYTFYRVPSMKTLDGWVEATPPNFVFGLKAPKRITHSAKLKDCGDVVARFIETVGALGGKLGVILFQLPPTFKQDLEVLSSFLEAMPSGLRAAFEFRHASWHHPDVYSLLAAKNVALCIAESEKLVTPVIATADYGYLRLRTADYNADDMARWAEVIQMQGARWKDVFVYYKHEDSGTGPRFARELMQRLGMPDPAQTQPPA